MNHEYSFLSYLIQNIPDEVWKEDGNFYSKYDFLSIDINELFILIKKNKTQVQSIFTFTKDKMYYENYICYYQIGMKYYFENNYVQSVFYFNYCMKYYHLYKNSLNPFVTSYKKYYIHRLEHMLYASYCLLQQHECITGIHNIENIVNQMCIYMKEKNEIQKVIEITLWFSDILSDQLYVGKSIKYLKSLQCYFHDKTNVSYYQLLSYTSHVLTRMYQHGNYHDPIPLLEKIILSQYYRYVDDYTIDWILCHIITDHPNIQNSFSCMNPNTNYYIWLHDLYVYTIKKSTDTQEMLLIQQNILTLCTQIDQLVSSVRTKILIHHTLKHLHIS